MTGSVEKLIPVSLSSNNFSSSNIDSFISTGIIQGYFSTGSAPSGIIGAWGILIVAHEQSAVVNQIAITPKGVASRSRESGTWGSWKSVTLA